MSCHFLLHGIFPTQESNPCLLHCRHWQVDSLPWATRKALYSKVSSIMYFDPNTEHFFLKVRNMYWEKSMIITVVVVQLLNPVQLFVTPWTGATRLLCPPLSPGVCSNSCSLSLWCYLPTSSSATSFSFCFQSLPASGSFPMSQLYTSFGQSTGASASITVLPINIHLLWL